jgi:hypothetical protein
MKRFTFAIAFAAIGLAAFAQSTTNKTPLLRGLLQGGLDANNQAITNGPASIGTNGTVYYGNAANLTNVPAPTAFGTPTTMSLTASNGFIDLGPTTNRPLWIGSGGTLTNGALNAGSGLTATTNNNSVSLAVTTNTYAVTANNLSDVTASTARANLGINTNLFAYTNAFNPFNSSNYFGATIYFPANGLTFEATPSVNPNQNPQVSFRGSPMGSSGGWTIFSTGTNTTGGTQYASSGTTNFYWYDQYAMSAVVWL